MPLDYITRMLLAKIIQKLRDLQIIFPDDLPVIHDLPHTDNILFIQQMLHGTAVNDPPCGLKLLIG